MRMVRLGASAFGIAGKTVSKSVDGLRRVLSSSTFPLCLKGMAQSLLSKGIARERPYRRLETTQIAIEALDLSTARRRESRSPTFRSRVFEHIAWFLGAAHKFRGAFAENAAMILEICRI